MKDIHRLRLNIKRMRALLMVSEAVSEGHFSKASHYQLLAPIFKSAGALREAQINSELIVQFDIEKVTPFLKHLKQIEKKSTSKLIASAKSFDRLTLDNLNTELIQKISHIPNRRIDEIADLKITDTIDSVHVLLQRSAYDNLHNIRKYLKAAAEILLIMDPTTKSDLLQSEIRGLNLKIGQWHDHVVLKNAFKSFIHKYPHAIEISYGKELLDNMENDTSEKAEQVRGLIIERLSVNDKPQPNKDHWFLDILWKMAATIIMAQIIKRL
jgi:CHAD domain-containing protein